MTQRPDYYYAFDSTDGVHVKQSDARDDIAALRARIAELETREEVEAKKIWEQLKRITELEAALKFYANKGHWMTDGLGPEPVSHIDLDGGDIARRALDMVK